MYNLSKEIKVSTAITPTAGVAAATDIEGTTLDMSGCEEVMLVLYTGTITAGAVTTVKWQQGDESDLSDAADLEGTSMTIAVTDDDVMKISDLIKPTKRYVRAYVDRATQNAVIASAVYLQSGWKKTPVTQGTGVTAEIHSSPDEGTA